jgi:hypothetical protein
MSNPYTSPVHNTTHDSHPGLDPGGEVAELGGSRHLRLGYASDKHLVINTATLKLPN